VTEHDLLVVGGGITGLSVAVHAARAGLATVLVEAGPLGGVSTQRSGALVRTHYADPGSARLALAGLEDFERFGERYGGPAGFTATGFAYVPDAAELADGSFGARVAMLRDLGVETEVLDAGRARALDPAIALAGGDVVAHEPRSGYADPAQATATLAAAARGAGADLRPYTTVARLLRDDGGDGAIAGARLRDGRAVSAAATVLCAGAWSVALAAMAGVDLPIRATAVKLAFFSRSVATHLTLIDAPNGTYLRPDGAAATLVGRRTWTDEPLAGPDAPLPEVDQAFIADAHARLARRLPSAAGAHVLAARAGMLDMTPDGLALVGPSELGGLWLCCGWSGTGFKTGPAVGAALAPWIAGGEPPAALASLHPARAQAATAVARSPH
jgi:glycine/D-amino acid oxidase-like deaminating enzyme